MIVSQFNSFWTINRPGEAEAKLVVDAYAMLPLAFPLFAALGIVIDDDHDVDA